MNAITCSKAIRACSNDEATITVSPRSTASGPSRVAQAIPDKSAVLPFPRAIESAADWHPGAKAPRTKRASHGNTRNGSPASRPCETTRPPRYSISRAGVGLVTAQGSRRQVALGIPVAA